MNCWPSPCAYVSRIRVKPRIASFSKVTVLFQRSQILGEFRLSHVRQRWRWRCKHPQAAGMQRDPRMHSPPAHRHGPPGRCAVAQLINREQGHEICRIRHSLLRRCLRRAWPRSHLPPLTSVRQYGRVPPETGCCISSTQACPRLTRIFSGISPAAAAMAWFQFEPQSPRKIPHFHPTMQ